MGSAALQQVRSFVQSAVIPILRWNCCCRITRQSAPSNPQTGLTGHFIPPGMECVPRRLAILKANRYMVEHSDCIIAYIRHPGNARNLLEYARKCSIPVWEV